MVEMDREMERRLPISHGSGCAAGGGPVGLGSEGFEGAVGGEVWGGVLSVFGSS